jgi:hypothetical protein
MLKIQYWKIHAKNTILEIRAKRRDLEKFMLKSQHIAQINPIPPISQSHQKKNLIIIFHSLSPYKNIKKFCCR